MPKLSVLTKQLKHYALNPVISDEDFLNAFLNTFVTAGNIKNKNHEEFRLSKARTSEVMNQKTDVPLALRKCLAVYGIREKTINEMTIFIDDYLDPHRIGDLADKIHALTREEGIQEEVNDELLSDSDYLSSALSDLLLKAITETNLFEAKTTLLWKHGNNSIDVLFGDLFHYGFDNRHLKKNIVVIPVNTAFDTHVTRKLEGSECPLVSENTLHGQWLTRMSESGENLKQIDSRITESLKHTGFKPLKEPGTNNGKKKSYPIGSVAIIETSNAFYFLVAVSEFDNFNNARSSSSNIEKAVSLLIKMYDRYGQGYDLYLPLIGTGLSRAGLSTQEAYDLLINCLENNSSKVQGHVHLVLKPSDKYDIELQKER